ncbi:hypothetical protein GCM10010402_50140 [Actinomadura luteofluorescens]|nr:ATPase, P-type (transporting), HAD superfamily, subfamily IC [Actinomadura glauciflava]
MRHHPHPEPAAGTAVATADPRDPLPRLREELRTGERGLSEREAARRLAVYGPNQVRRRERRSLIRLVSAQLLHPLALLLWGAGLLAFVAGMPVLGWAILAVILVNAVFALLQEHQAERAVEALAAYLPEQAHVVRDGTARAVEATGLVPGDLIALEEGDKVPADARLTDGALELDLSMLTGESAPVDRVAAPAEQGVALLHEPNLVFSGTTCTGGRPGRSCSRPAGTPSSAASRRSASARRAARAPWRPRSRGSPG